MTTFDAPEKKTSSYSYWNILMSVWSMSHQIILSLTPEGQLLMPFGKKPFENTVEKQKNAGNQHFLISHNVVNIFRKKKLHPVSHIEIFIR